MFHLRLVFGALVILGALSFTTQIAHAASTTTTRPPSYATTTTTTAPVLEFEDPTTMCGPPECSTPGYGFDTHTSETPAPNPEGQESVCGNGVTQSECDAELAESTTSNGQASVRSNPADGPLILAKGGRYAQPELPQTGWLGDSLFVFGLGALGMGLSLLILTWGLPK